VIYVNVNNTIVNVRTSYVIIDARVEIEGLLIEYLAEVLRTYILVNLSVL
jgi:hypothetical protein